MSFSEANKSVYHAGMMDRDNLLVLLDVLMTAWIKINLGPIP